MKRKNNLNKETLIGLYYENKEFTLPIFSIVISVLLFLVFIIPQLISFPSRKNGIDSENAKLNAIKESEKILSTANADSLNSDVELAAKVLPKDKALEDSINAIFTSASLSNAQIESYDFVDSNSPNIAQGELSKLNFNVGIFGGMDQAADFINVLYKTYPVSEVENVKYKEGISTLSLFFYYSPFVSNSLNDRTAVREMSKIEESTLKELRKWNDNSRGSVFNFIPSSTESGRTGSSPF